MIEKSKIENNFIQTGNTCVLSSYGIAANYFSGIPVLDYFSDYCMHFHLPLKNGNQQSVYESHFHQHIYTAKISGYDLIANLYNNSSQNSFSQDRINFSISIFKNTSSSLKQIKKCLINKQAFLLLTYSIQRNFHSVVIGYDNGFHLRNPINNSLQMIHSIETVGALQDSLLICKK